MDDERIIDLYWQRNEDAINESNAKYGKYCHSVANNILCSNEDSEECVNDTWMRAWNAMPPTRPSVLRMFFAKITRNLSLNRLKARSAEKRIDGEITLVLDELDECIAGGANVEREFEQGELVKTINRFVDSLNKRDGDIFARRYFFNESVRDIAKRYGLTANHTSVILSRTRQKLRAVLESEGYIDGQI